MSNGAGAHNNGMSSPVDATFPRKRSVTRRFPEVELVEGEFQFVTESRKPSTTTILVPPIHVNEKDGILRDDYWSQIRTEWRVSEDNEDDAVAQRCTGTSTPAKAPSTRVPAHPIPRASLELPPPCTAYLQTRCRDGPFEPLFPGSTEHYEKCEDARAQMASFGFHRRNPSDSTPLPYHGSTTSIPRTIEHPEKPRWSGSVEPKTLARSLFYFGFVFMPFWIINIIIMVVSIQPTPEWEESRKADGLSDRERAEYLQWIRQTELKWCKRSLLALVACTIGWACIIVIVKYSIMRGVDY